MGNLVASNRPRFRVVGSTVGTVRIVGGPVLGDGRLWLLDNHELHVVVNGKDGELRREVYQVSGATMSRAQGTFELEDGGKVVVAVKSCNCGMGTAGNAGITDAPHTIDTVAVPDWVSLS